MDYNNKPDGYYKNIRHEMLAFLPSDAKRVLDVGCGVGAFANAIKTKYEAEVWGIELMPDAAREATKVLDKVFVGPCEEFIEQLPDDFFDVIYFNDVLEHLVDPYSILEIIKNKLSKNGVVISSIPNVRYYRVFREIYFKEDFKYREDGVMDKTHLRFFTKKSIQRMYEDIGFEVISHVGINGEKSIKPYLYNIPRFFKGMDMQHLQFATVARKV